VSGVTDRGRGGLALVCLLFTWALIPLALLLVEVQRRGGVLSGSDGALAGADQLFYMANIRDAGEHLLISNQFRLGHSDAVLLHPMFLISGVLWQLGLSVKLALLIWKPVAAALLGFGIWAYCGRFLAGRGRIAAALLAAFYFSPVLPLLVWGDAGLSGFDHFLFTVVSGEAMPALQLWGYLHTALALGLMPLAVLAAERRRLVWASLAGAAIGWLHPWQGVELVAILVGVAAWGRFAPRYRVLAVPAIATTLPMAYLFVLSRADPDWRLDSSQTNTAHAPAWMLLAALLPLVVPALPALRRRVADEGERMLLLWIAAGIVLYLGIHSFPFHALQGTTIPLSVLAVRGFQRLRLPAPAAVAAVALLTVPGMVFMVDTFRDNRSAGVAPYRLTAGENAALHYLDGSKRPGGVLARYYLGMTVPALTGRDTWVGHFAWTPDFTRRSAQAEDLFAGRMDPAAAQALVLSIRPAYLLADCSQRADLRALLGPAITGVHRFGCAAVYDVTR
jgi:hypothetical protein